MGVKIVGGASAASVNGISFVQHGRASSTLESVIRSHHIYKHIWQPLVGEILTLEREEGNNHDNSLSVSSRMLLALAMFLESFRECFGTSSGTEGPSLVKLPGG